MLMGLILAGPTLAQDRPAPMDLLDLNASAATDVAADTAVVVLSAVREGPDIAALTQEVDLALTHALSESRSSPTVQASSGGYTTQARMDKGSRNGWSVHGDLILKSHDFIALGKLIGKLTGPPGSFQVASSSFEVSAEARQEDEGELINRAVAAFKNKANTTVKALGYTGWVIRQFTLGSLITLPGPRPVLSGKSAASDLSSAVPSAFTLEPGRITLQLQVSGTVQMRH